MDIFGKMFLKFLYKQLKSPLKCLMNSEHSLNPYYVYL